MKMLLYTAREVVDDALQRLKLVVFGVSVDREGLQLFQARREGVMLFNIRL